MERGEQGITPALPSPPQQHQANERIKKESESAQKYQSLLWQIICIVKNLFANTKCRQFTMNKAQRRKNIVEMWTKRALERECENENIFL